MVLDQRVSDAVLDPAGLAELRGAFSGDIVLPGDAEYDTARRIWNGMIDRRPAVIARCENSADVAKAIAFARGHDLVVAIRGGGHSIPGHSMCDGGLVIDLSLMKHVEVDPDARVAKAGAGVLLGELDQATQQYGLAVPAGLISHTGIAGLTLGGGTGWLMRKYGLTVDNLNSVEIVTADGRILRASEDENSDLFWAVRGGGGNFGVVTEFEYRLQPLGPEVLAGPLFFTLDKARAVIRNYREVMSNAPDELTSFMVFMTLPPHAPFPPELQGKTVLALAFCYAGPIEDGVRVVRPLRESVAPDLDMSGPMPFVAFQSMFNAGAPHGLHQWNKSGYVKDLDDDVVDRLLANMRAVSSPLTQIHIARMGGAISRVPADATPFGHRDAPYLVWITTSWLPSSPDETHIGWTRAVWAALEPYSTGGVYVNALGDEGDGRIRAAFGDANYERLVTVKRKYDPTNLFRLNQNIKP